MEKYQPYPQYTEEGVPETWRKKRLRFALRMNPSKNAVRLNADELVSFVPMDAVGEYGGIRLEEEKELREIGGGYTYFCDGDVVVAKITPCFENGKGALAKGLTNKTAFGTTELHVLRASEESLEPAFLFYVTISDSFRKLGESEMYGAGGQKRVPENIFKDFRAGLPPLNEQRTIVRFLDYKTGQIDALIAKKEALLARLAEKRIALISHAVTKGLDPSVPMKDSGVAWLGEIPVHWDAKKIKYFASILRGKFSHRPRNDPRFYGGDYPFIQTGDVANANKFINEYSQTLNEEGLKVSKSFPAGTLVMTIAANIGDMAILNFEACFPDSIVGFIPKDDVDLNFLFYLFTAMRQQLLSTAVLNTQLNLNIERIGDQIGSFPLKHEQEEISNYLDGVTLKIADQTSFISVAIAKLKEYRAALITNAVTGKVDVRQFALPTTGQEAAHA